MLQAKTGTATTPYLYAIGTRPLAQYTSGSAEYLLPDALGSVRQIADANGNITLAESYEPYGTVLSSIGTASSIFAYAGEQVDTSGLVFLRARYMQPRLGIFLARDPLNSVPRRPRSYHPYNYVEGNAINATDPMGLCTRCRRGSAVTVRSPQLGVTEINVRSSPSAADESNIVTTLPNGAQVVIAEDTPLAGGGLYWHSTYLSRWLGGGIGINYGQVWIWNDALVDDPDDPGPNPPPGPGPDPGGSGGLTQLPVESPVYDNGYGMYPTWDYPFHDGYDIHSQTGNRTVYSMGGGTVDDINSTSWMGMRILMDAGYYIRYVHVRAGNDICVGNRVEAGTVLGEYDLIGRTNYYHVHVGFERNWNDPFSPASYWPGGAPEQFVGQWGNPE